MYSSVHSLIHRFIYSFIHSFIHSLIHFLIHSLYSVPVRLLITIASDHSTAENDSFHLSLKRVRSGIEEGDIAYIARMSTSKDCLTKDIWSARIRDVSWCTEEANHGR